MPQCGPVADEHLDELPDRWFGRPVAGVLVRLLLPSPVTPDQLTVTNAALGVAAAVALAVRADAVFVVCMLAMIVVDCADGQLARARGTSGLRGRIIDGAGDYVSGVSLHVGLGLALLDEHGFVAAAAWATAAGVAMAWTAFLFDSQKRRFAGTVDDPEVVRAHREGDRGLWRFVDTLFLGYAERIAALPAIPDLDAYRARVRPAMLVLLIVGPTTHFAVWAVLVALDAPLAYAQVSVASAIVGAAGLAFHRWLERHPSPVTAPGR